MKPDPSYPQTSEEPLPPLNRLLRLEEADAAPDNGEAEDLPPLGDVPPAAAPEAPLKSPINKEVVAPKRPRKSNPAPDRGAGVGAVPAARSASPAKGTAPRRASTAPKRARPATPSGYFAPRGWGWPRIVTAIVAVMVLTILPLTWLEISRIDSGAEALREWVQAGVAPLPPSLKGDTSKLTVQPRRAIRLTNFIGEGQYAYELRETTAEGSRLVGKYLLGYGDDGFYLLIAFDAGRDAQMTVPASLSPPPAAAGR